MYGDYFILKQIYCKFFLKCRVYYRGQIIGIVGYFFFGFVDQWSIFGVFRNVQDYN